MKSPIRIAVGGIVLWLVPFLVSIPFFSSDGELLIRQQVFGTIMNIVLALSIAAVVSWFFKQKQEDWNRPLSRYSLAHYELGVGSDSPCFSIWYAIRRLCHAGCRILCGRPHNNHRHWLSVEPSPKYLKPLSGNWQ